ncbi:hypothetical protein I4F81_001158 [Pyropia yezoensis]|uniref:Uncharacterized protein n=1 Tax=Pyropia yezoensis TaxID=2788 RepID=A0ACC3BKW5_PYRYE|nr:hypothetical protein I4F81_001158 [Neopyropia yezoensis]
MTHVRPSAQGTAGIRAPLVQAPPFLMQPTPCSVQQRGASKGPSFPVQSNSPPPPPPPGPPMSVLPLANASHVTVRPPRLHHASLPPDSPSQKSVEQSVSGPSPSFSHVPLSATSTGRLPRSVMTQTSPSAHGTPGIRAPLVQAAPSVMHPTPFSVQQRGASKGLISPVQSSSPPSSSSSSPPPPSPSNEHVAPSTGPVALNPPSHSAPARMHGLQYAFPSLEHSGGSRHSCVQMIGHTSGTREYTPHVVTRSESASRHAAAAPSAAHTNTVQLFRGAGVVVQTPESGRSTSGWPRLSRMHVRPYPHASGWMREPDTEHRAPAGSTAAAGVAAPAAAAAATAARAATTAGRRSSACRRVGAIAARSSNKEGGGRGLQRVDPEGVAVAGRQTRGMGTGKVPSHRRCEWTGRHREARRGGRKGKGKCADSDARRAVK